MNDDAPRVVEVIRLYVTRGEGTEQDRCRRVLQIWTTDGQLLAENDPCGPSLVPQPPMPGEESAPNNVSVRCPDCTFTGVSSRWGGGCPACGAKLIPDDSAEASR
jgi:hypothetical protein